MKKTVLHVVETLAVGGAEVLLTESLKSFSDSYRHVLVYMRPPTTLLPKVKAEAVYCLNYKGKRSLLRCTYKLRRIIEHERVYLIHSHYYWPTILARFAKLKQIPLLFTIHNPLSYDAFKLNKLSFYLEKLTFQRNQHPIFVSRAVMEDYKKYIDIKGEYSVLYNFASDVFYTRSYERLPTINLSKLNIVALGNLKTQKNYKFLIEVFRLLKNHEIYLDIFGDGPLKEKLALLIEENDLKKVKLKGSSDKIFEQLQHYDAYIMASTYEGFGIATVEAMAVGLPCLLSDMPTNREVAGDAAIYFNLLFANDCAEKLIGLLKNREVLEMLSDASKKMAMSYQKQKYINKLESLYNKYLQILE